MTLHLEGKAAEEFLKYDQRELTKEEKKSLKEAVAYYLKHCGDIEREPAEIWEQIVHDSNREPLP